MYLVKKKKRQLSEHKRSQKDKKTPAELLILSQGLKNRESSECHLISS